MRPVGAESVRLLFRSYKGMCRVLFLYDAAKKL